MKSELIQYSYVINLIIAIVECTCILFNSQKFAFFSVHELNKYNLLFS